MEILGSLLNSKNSLKLIQDDSGTASIFGIPINTLGNDTIQTNDNIYILTPEIHKTLSSTSYSGKTGRNENDILVMNNIKND